MKTLTHFRKAQPNNDTSIELASFTFFDIETTGLRPDRGARITEIAIYDRSNEQFQWEQHPSDKKLAEQLPIVIDLLTTGVIVGHNVGFDFKFIAYETERLGFRGPNVLFIDTLGLAQKLCNNISNFKLSSMLTKFDISPDGALHTAAVDAQATRALFWKLISMGEIETLGQAGMQRINWSTF